ncbi:MULTISPECIES: hypothetical protein [Galbibacter]|uniref:Uncharacterized protein n=1 Tax=Galbibacter pacificus TaxID=2996052 RepID=A0ABT6FQ30_9FLAO|nr:hypothetical protein [Galbibacter pacificus]MDG3582152.1 hypothetical protein [Galbibacter pacificus]MDG3585372.1 hypothetical protein [Galbibacter pacificus]
MAKKPKKCITPKKAQKLEEKFAKTIRKALKKEFGKDFSCEFWWSVDELEEYIKYFKEEAKQKGYTDLGLRFSLGMYEDDEKDGDISGFIKPTGTKAETASLKSAAAEPIMIQDVDSYNDGYNDWPPPKG